MGGDKEISIKKDSVTESVEDLASRNGDQPKDDAEILIAQSNEESGIEQNEDNISIQNKIEKQEESEVRVAQMEADNGSEKNEKNQMQEETEGQANVASGSEDSIRNGDIVHIGNVSQNETLIVMDDQEGRGGGMQDESESGSTDSAKLSPTDGKGDEVLGMTLAGRNQNGLGKSRQSSIIKPPSVADFLAGRHKNELGKAESIDKSVVTQLDNKESISESDISQKTTDTDDAIRKKETINAATKFRQLTNDKSDTISKLPNTNSIKKEPINDIGKDSGIQVIPNVEGKKGKSSSDSAATLRQDMVEQSTTKKKEDKSISSVVTSDKQELKENVPNNEISIHKIPDINAEYDETS